MRKCKLLAIPLTLCLLISGCSISKNKEDALQTNINSPYIQKEGFLLDTIIDIKIYDNQDNSLLEKSFDLISDLEKKLSSHQKDAEIYKLNHSNNEFVELSQEAIECIKQGIHYGELTNGSFDITIGAVSLLWDFKTPGASIPDDSNIKKNLDKINYKDILIDGNKVKLLKPDMAIDLGAIAKGYVADKVKSLLVENNVHSAIINLGGNVLTIGKKGNTPFKVGIQDPKKERNQIIETVDIEDKSVVTSGIYERFIEYNGKKYHHILDPKTGYPVENDIIQTTIISDKSIDGDALSTCVFLLGKDKGLELIKSLKGVTAYFYLSNGDVLHSE